MSKINAQNPTRKVVDNFLSEPSSTNMLKLIEYAKKQGLTDSEITKLAHGLAVSGSTISNLDGHLSDIPSTGGPGSLSTLICPLLMPLFGHKVLKLGVPGRPAGGIDVLAQLPGYRTNPNLEEIKAWLSASGYVHFLANEKFAPLDAKLFEFRKINDAVNIPCLAIASLLSKKIAVGLKIVGLDIRVFSGGNFGTDFQQARKNAIRFNRISKLIGIKSTCFLTDGNILQQPYLGRGESILAIKHLFERKNPALEKHFGILVGMAQSISEHKEIKFGMRDVENVFFKNIETQGTSSDDFLTLASRIELSHINSIVANKNGFLRIDIDLLRSKIIEIQAASKTNHQFPDPCGLIIKKMPSDFISKGEEICSYRCSEGHLDGFKKTLERALQIQSLQQLSHELEVI